MLPSCTIIVADNTVQQAIVFIVDRGCFEARSFSVGLLRCDALEKCVAPLAEIEMSTKPSENSRFQTERSIVFSETLVKRHQAMKNPFQPILDQQGVVILDGALATELERRGADLNDSLWSAKILLEQPDLIRQVHTDYFVAGANVATTASYQATFPGLIRRGLTPDQAADLMHQSVQLAIEARTAYQREHQLNNSPFTIHHSQFLVAASIGPYGAYLADGSEYRGDYGLSIEQLIDFHRPRMAVLAASGADLLACETIPSLAEGEALVRLLGEFPDIMAWLSFSCCDETHVCHGETFAECVALANQSAQVVAVGLNCTPPRFVEPLLRSVAGVTEKLLLVYPNSGERWDAANHCWLAGTGVTDFREPVKRWYAAGARLIGGCCRTTPADIRAMANVLID
jgi:homocysteine S-methyltransferase